MNPVVFFLLVLKSSLFSTSGLGNLPQLYDDMTSGGYATEEQFAEALAVGQVTPGPSGLWVVSLGYLVDGWRGAGLASLAIVIPPLLVLGLERVYRRIGHAPAVQGFVRGLSLAVVGVFLVVLVGLLQASGLNGATLMIVAGSIALGLVRRIPVLVVLLLAAVVGVLVFGGD